MAKRFFYVCAGLLFLALAYHVEAKRATAQEGGLIQVGEVSYFYGSLVGVVQGRTIYTARVPNDPGPLLVEALPPLPGTSPIVAVNGITQAALLENRDVYVRENNDWVLKGNMLGGATGATQATWGSLKARYRK